MFSSTSYVDPSRVVRILPRGEESWVDVESFEMTRWRVAPAGDGGPGRVGFTATTPDGRTITGAILALDGVETA